MKLAISFDNNTSTFLCCVAGSTSYCQISEYHSRLSAARNSKNKNVFNSEGTTYSFPYIISAKHSLTFGKSYDYLHQKKRPVQFSLSMRHMHCKRN